MQGVVIGSIIFLILAVVSCIGIGNYVVARSPTRESKTENRNVAWVVSLTAVISMWLIWISAYMHQLYPIINPEVAHSG